MGMYDSGRKKEYKHTSFIACTPAGGRVGNLCSTGVQESE